MKPLITVSVLSIGLTVMAQPKPSPAVPAVPPAPGLAVTPLAADSDDQAPNKPAALGEFLHPGIAVGGGAGMMGAGNRESTGPVSVLYFKDPDQKAVSETTEDLAVLSFLLSRNLEQAFASDANEYKLGIPMLLTSGKQAVAASYIEGFGAILKIQVRFPVVGLPEGAAEIQTEKTGSEWEEARRELLADENGGAALWDSRTQGYNRGQKADGQRYDAKLVQTLRKRVLVLLKNGANLRHLDGNEWIIVKIVGTPNLVKPSRGLARSASANMGIEERPIGDAGTINGRTFEPGTVAKNSEPPNEPSGQPNAHEKSTPTELGGPNEDATVGPAPTKKSKKHSSSNVRIATATADNLQTSSRPTIMTLRVKKSAVDAFAGGTLSEEQFVKQAEVATYLNPLPPNPRLTALSDSPTY